MLCERSLVYCKQVVLQRGIRPKSGIAYGNHYSADISTTSDLTVLCWGEVQIDRKFRSSFRCDIERV